VASRDLLHADAGALEMAGRDYLSCGDTIQESINRMRTQVNNLSSSFQGSAASAFYAKMDTLLQQLTLACSEVTEMGNDLNTTASRVRQLQAEAEAILRD
jgi:WXG100 family type VII secretion target